MNRNKIPVIRSSDLRTRNSHQQKIQTFVGIIRAETIVRHHKVPSYEPHHTKASQQGYQRVPTESRINSLALAIKEKRVDLPTSVLLSIRGKDVGEEVLFSNKDGEFWLELDPDKADDQHALYVVDGQHRIKALEKVMGMEDVNIRNVKIPFVCMIGADEYKEMEQFHVINSNAKPVPIDLAFALLKKRAENDPEFRNFIENTGHDWKVRAQELVELLARSSKVWKGFIRLPNISKGKTTVPSSSFVKSLKHMLTASSRFEHNKTLEQQVRIIDAYWEGIFRVLPSASEKPADYSIRKGMGVDVMHALFPLVLDYAVAQGGTIYKAESYEKVLREPLQNLEGTNSNGDSVNGEEFWRTGKLGAAGSYSSVAGKRALEKSIRRLFPDLDME